MTDTTKDNTPPPTALAAALAKPAMPAKPAAAKKTEQQESPAEAKAETPTKPTGDSAADGAAPQQQQRRRAPTPEEMKAEQDRVDDARNMYIDARMRTYRKIDAELKGKHGVSSPGMRHSLVVQIMAEQTTADLINHVDVLADMVASIGRMKQDEMKAMFGDPDQRLVVPGGAA